MGKSSAVECWVPCINASNVPGPSESNQSFGSLVSAVAQRLIHMGPALVPCILLNIFEIWTMCDERTPDSTKIRYQNHTKTKQCETGLISYMPWASLSGQYPKLQSVTQDLNQIGCPLAYWLLNNRPLLLPCSLTSFDSGLNYSSASWKGACMQKGPRQIDRPNEISRT